MTPEREAYFRIHAFRCDMEDLIEALDAARAERDKLRGRVAAFEGYMRLLRERYLDLKARSSSETAAKVHEGLAESTDGALAYGRTLGLWE